MRELTTTELFDISGSGIVTGIASDVGVNYGKETIQTHHGILREQGHVTLSMNIRGFFEVGFSMLGRLFGCK